MNKTRVTSTGAKLTVDTRELQDMLCCGRVSAVKIGEFAGAKINIGRRVLWNVALIQRYLDNAAAGEGIEE
jgi:hypothetical protein